MSRISALAVSVVLVACSGTAEETEPPPATRPTIAPPVTTTEPEPVATENASDPTESPETTTTVPEPLDYSIEFEDLGAGVDGGWITVPVDYGDPQGETLDLWVTRHRAGDDDRIGILLMNNGGPGVPASSVAANVRGFLMEPLVERFDVVSWDPRGTGVSDGAVDCFGDDEYDRYFGSSDITPETDEDRAEPPLGVGSDERQQSGHGSCERERDRRGPQRGALDEVEHDPERETCDCPAFRAAGCTRSGSKGQHDLDDHTRHLDLGEQIALQCQHHHADGNQSDQ